MSKGATSQPPAPTDPNASPAARGSTTNISAQTTPEALPGGTSGGGSLKGGASGAPPSPSADIAGWNGNGDPVDAQGNVIQGGQRINSAPAGTTPTYAPPPTPAGGSGGSAGGGSSALLPSGSPGSNQAFRDMPNDPMGRLDTSNVPGLVSGDALTQMMKQQQDASYKTATGYLDPQFASQQRDMETKLANQGVPQNSEAWNRAMDEFNRNKTFAYGQAEGNAVQQGNAAQQQLFGQGLAANANQFGQDLSSGNFANSAQAQLVQQILASNAFKETQQQHDFSNSMALRNQDINELLMQQQNPLQMLNYLLSGNNVQTPNFTQTPGANVAGTDIAGIINAATGQANNVYNAQVGNANSGNAGIAAILATLLRGGVSF